MRFVFGKTEAFATAAASIGHSDFTRQESTTDMFANTLQDLSYPPPDEDDRRFSLWLKGGKLRRRPRLGKVEERLLRRRHNLALRQPAAIDDGATSNRRFRPRAFWLAGTPEPNKQETHSPAAPARGKIQA